MISSNSPSIEALHYCLISDSELINTVIRLGCPEPCSLDLFTFDEIVDTQMELSKKGQLIVQRARERDAVLIAWDVDKAAVINTLSYHLRHKLIGPIIALCSNNYNEKIAALASGADDAVMLPVSSSLIQAIVVSYHRLAKAAQNSNVEAIDAIPLFLEPQKNPIGRGNFGPLRIDNQSHKFFIDDNEVLLTPREYALINYLISNAEKACSRDQVLGDVWGISFETGTNMVDVYMYFLRKKLEAHGIKGMIETIRGLGYRLSLPK